ncbi:hypothetical protein BH09GEM1_BH09GEM1_12070 [soil metagenome]
MTTVEGNAHAVPAGRHALGRAARPAPGTDPREALRQTAQSLQSVFVEQLFKAMRATVPVDGLTSGGQGEDMFREMLDQQAAELAPAQWQHAGSLGDAVVRQLAGALKAPGTPSTPGNTNP